MPTINQLVRKGRRPRGKRKMTPALAGKPQRLGVIIQIGITQPKKPNSGKRKTCRVRFVDGTTALCIIPGIGHNLAEHSNVLVEGGGKPDLPGVKYHVVRGAADCGPPKIERKTGRSRYGTRKGK